MGSIHSHDASTASRRMKSVASPAITSSSNRSYASGDCSPKVDPYWKSIFTGCTCTWGPGSFAEIRSDRPSSGWMRRASMLEASGASRSRLNRICGTSLKWTAISLARLGRRLPVRR